MDLSEIRSSHLTHDVADVYQGQPRGETRSAAAPGGSEVGGEETDKGKAKNGSGSKSPGGGGGTLSREPTAMLSGAAPSESGAVGPGAAATGDGDDQKSRGGKHTLRKTAARLAIKLSETSMVRKRGRV